MRSSSSSHASKPAVDVYVDAAGWALEHRPAAALELRDLALELEPGYAWAPPDERLTPWAELVDGAGAVALTTKVADDDSTPLHVDGPPGSRTALVVYRVGDYTGGETTFPGLGVTVDMGDGDLLLWRAGDVVHGTLPRHGAGRRSIVLRLP